MSLGSAFDRTPLPPQSPHGVVLGGTVAHVEETLPLSGPRAAVAKLPNHPAIVTVVNSRFISKMSLLSIKDNIQLSYDLITGHTRPCRILWS